MANPQVAHRLQQVKPSPTLAMNSRAAALKAEGKDIISMGVGEPDFDTPEHIRNAAIAALDAGQTRYTAVGGTPELKQAVIDKFARDNGLTYTPEEVLISTGGKQSIYNLLQAMINPGDEVIIPAPYWVSYPDMVLLAEGVPVTINTTLDNRFKITQEQLEAAITGKTRLVLLNSPSNPSGMSYTHEELVSLANVLLKHPQVMVATDDMYEHIRWGDTPFANIVTACPELKERAVVLNGVSKAYAMTGWRIGFAGGPAWLIKAMTKVQSQSTSNPCSIAQAAAVEALNGPKDCLHAMVKEFEKRHNYVVDRLQAMSGVNVLKGDATFYSFPNIDGVLAEKGLSSDLELAEILLAEGVAVVPGSAFGAPGHLRISFAASMETLGKALDRLEKGLSF